MVRREGGSESPVSIGYTCSFAQPCSHLGYGSDPAWSVSFYFYHSSRRLHANHANLRRTGVEMDFRFVWSGCLPQRSDGLTGMHQISRSWMKRMRATLGWCSRVIIGGPVRLDGGLLCWQVDQMRLINDLVSCNLAGISFVAPRVAMRRVLALRGKRLSISCAWWGENNHKTIRTTGRQDDRTIRR